MCVCRTGQKARPFEEGYPGFILRQSLVGEYAHLPWCKHGLGEDNFLDIRTVVTVEGILSILRL